MDFSLFPATQQHCRLSEFNRLAVSINAKCFEHGINGI